MPFYLSKIGFLMVMPSNMVGFTALLALGLLILGWQKWALRCFALAAILVMAFGYSPLPNLALLTLEDRFPMRSATAPELKSAEGIIILGGSFNPYMSHHRTQISINDTIERVTEGVALARQLPNLKLIFTGGTATLSSGFDSEAKLARDFLTSQGIPTQKIIFEDKSLNTYENAMLSADILKPKPGQKWVLVTSAFHMPRAVALFRAQGFEVIPYPVDYHLSGSKTLFRPHVDLTEGLSYSDIAAKEWLGLFVYWAGGKISEIFPKP